MLDSANFNAGTVNVTKSVSIRAIPGQVGSIVAVGGANAMNLSAGVSVRLQNVAVLNNATSPGSNGVVMTTGSLSIHDSSVSVPGDGIQVTGGSVEVRNVSFIDGTNGVHALANSTVDVTGSKFVNASFGGVYLEGGVASTTTSGAVTDSSFAGCNFAFGLNQYAAGSVLHGMMTRSSVTHGVYGIATAGNATVNVGNSSFFNTQVALNGSSIESMGNNQVRMNGAPGGVTVVPAM